MTRLLPTIFLSLAVAASAAPATPTPAKAPAAKPPTTAKAPATATKAPAGDSTPAPSESATPAPSTVPAGPKITFSQCHVDGPFIAMTFDDGPHGANTPRLLEILKQRKIHATFFVVGQCVAEYPEIVKKIVTEGHEIANHSWSHPDLSGKTEAAVKEQIQKTHDAIITACGVAPKLMRPPYGAFTARQRAWANGEWGYKIILWDVDPLDWKVKDADHVKSEILKATVPGSIILSHDIHKTTVDAMPETLDALLAKGFKFVTVSELLAMDKPVVPKPKATPAPKADAPASTKGATPAPAKADAPAAAKADPATKVEPATEASTAKPKPWGRGADTMKPGFRASAALLLLGLTATASAGGPHPALPAPVVPECLGVNIHFTRPQPGELEMLAAAGFRWVRRDIVWSEIEKKPGEYDFSAYDQLVAALDKHKLRALFVLDYGHPLYADEGDKFPYTSRAGTPEFRAAFARWAAATVQRFAGHGCLWEMWNEADANHWKPKPNYPDYIALARETGHAVRAAAPGEALIGPAAAKVNLKFLEACFQGGLLEYWDAVSVHPYRHTDPETVVPEYQALRQLIAKYAPAGKVIPIIAGEVGYSASWPGYDEQKKAQMFGRLIETNLTQGIPLTIWYDWRDDGPTRKATDDHFGLVAHDYYPGEEPPLKPWPLYFAVKKFTEEKKKASMATQP